MVSYRLDFLDKLVIAITCVIVTFICVFNTFCFADENVSLNVLSGIATGSTDAVTSFYSSANGSITYFFAEKGYSYTIVPVNNSYDRPSVVSSSVPAVGVPFERLYTWQSNNDTFSFSPSSDCYVSINGTVTSWTVTKTQILGFDNAISSLVENVGISSIWDTFSISLPYVSVVVLAGFGFYLIFHNIKELSKGREKMN